MGRLPKNLDRLIKVAPVQHINLHWCISEIKVQAAIWQSCKLRLFVPLKKSGSLPQNYDPCLLK